MSLDDCHWETECPRSNDKQHCDCWYDGKPCCRCGAAMNFGDALKAAKDGQKIGRSGWNGKGKFIVYQKAYPNGIPINANTAEATGIAQGTVCVFRPYLMMKATDGAFFPWNPNQLD